MHVEEWSRTAAPELLLAILVCSVGAKRDRGDDGVVEGYGFWIFDILAFAIRRSCEF